MSTTATCLGPARRFVASRFDSTGELDEKSCDTLEEILSQHRQTRAAVEKLQVPLDGKFIHHSLVPVRHFLPALCSLKTRQDLMNTVPDGELMALYQLADSSGFEVASGSSREQVTELIRDRFTALRKQFPKTVEYLEQDKIPLEEKLAEGINSLADYLTEMANDSDEGSADEDAEELSTGQLVPPGQAAADA